jgi:hypothetical protein
MWDVFLDDMGLNNSVELALANLDLNELVLESVTFDDGDPLEGSSSTSTNARIALDIGEEEDGGERHPCEFIVQGEFLGSYSSKQILACQTPANY